MPTIDYDSYLDDEDLGFISAKRIDRKKRRLSEREKRIRLQAEQIELADKLPVDIHQNFSPTFQPARHERFWLLSYLEHFYNEQVITDILSQVKGGKEANVYLCAAHPSTGVELMAAKVYRPRIFRNLRNDARYRQGRFLLDEHGKASHSRREELAVRKNTRFGQELRHVSWLEAEFQALQRLHAAGADVPAPLLQGDNVIMMEYVGARHTPAVTLNRVNLTAQEALPLFERLVDNLAIMLSCHLVHADFSAYNILYWEGRVKIIDFPQAVDPRRNPEAPELFLRDVERLCQYFGRYGIQREAHALADELWSRYQRANALDASAMPDLQELLEADSG